MIVKMNYRKIDLNIILYIIVVIYNMSYLLINKTTIPFDKYLTNVIKGVDRKLLNDNLNDNELSSNQQKIREYFNEFYDKLTMPDYYALFIYTIIFNEKQFKSWDDVSKEYYNNITNIYFVSEIDNILNNYNCCCSHVINKLFRIYIKNRLSIIVGTTCISKEHITDDSCKHKLKMFIKIHDKYIRDKRKATTYNKKELAEGKYKIMLTYYNSNK
jgi:hypothetical protein